jgi:hypothetical protein
MLEARFLPMRFQHQHTPTIRGASGPSTILAVLTAVTISVAVAACGSGASPSAGPASHRTASSTSTTQTPTGAAASALSAYRGMWGDMVNASLTSDYQSPLLPEHASGQALSVLVQGLAKNQAQGIVIKGEPVLHPQITSLTPIGSPTQATISDCLDDSHWLQYKATGGLTDNTPGGRHAASAIVAENGDTWKVTQLAVQVTDTC